MRWRAAVAAVVGAALVLTLSACGGDDGSSRFGPVLSSVDEIVGTEILANRIVSMPCIPSRRDPVGVWLGIDVIAAEVDANVFTLDVNAIDARLGSHPSGCSNPQTLLAQSVFLFDGDEPVFASSQSIQNDVTTLVFRLDGRSPTDLDLVILPTFAFEKGNGDRETTVFGLIGRYSVA